MTGKRMRMARSRTISGVNSLASFNPALKEALPAHRSSCSEVMAIKPCAGETGASATLMPGNRSWTPPGVSCCRNSTAVKMCWHTPAAGHEQVAVAGPDSGSATSNSPTRRRSAVPDSPAIPASIPRSRSFCARRSNPLLASASSAAASSDAASRRSLDSSALIST